MDWEIHHDGDRDGTSSHPEEKVGGSPRFFRWRGVWGMLDRDGRSIWEKGGMADEGVLYAHIHVESPLSHP